MPQTAVGTKTLAILKVEIDRFSVRKVKGSWGEAREMGLREKDRSALIKWQSRLNSPILLLCL